MKLRKLITLIITFIFFCSCSTNRIPPQAKNALHNAEKFELLSIDPSVRQKSNSFLGWKILGKVSLKGQKRENILNAFEDGVSENSNMMAICFIPRHGIQVTHGGKTYKFAICFQCLRVLCMSEGQKEQRFLTSASPKKIFNSVLKKANVSLAK